MIWATFAAICLKSSERCLVIFIGGITNSLHLLEREVLHNGLEDDEHEDKWKILTGVLFMILVDIPQLLL